MDCENIRSRNLEHLSKVIFNYGLKFTLEELLSFRSVVYEGRGVGEFRVYGIRYDKEPYNTPTGAGLRTKQVKFSIYNFRKKSGRDMTSEQICDIQKIFLTFATSWKQLNLLKDMEEFERDYKSAVSGEIDAFIDNITSY